MSSYLFSCSRQHCLKSVVYIVVGLLGKWENDYFQKVQAAKSKTPNKISLVDVYTLIYYFGYALGLSLVLLVTEIAISAKNIVCV